RAIEEIAVRPEDILGAISVMDIEIDDRDPLGIVAFTRIERSDGGIVEQAEAHGAALLGMMAGRADGAEGIGSLTLEYRIDPGDRGAGAAQGGRERARRHPGV